jgi:tagaturonate reductase
VSERDRFRNPFLAHKLSDIAKNHEAKGQVRLQPTRDEYKKIFGREPAKLNEVLVWGLPSASQPVRVCT